MHYIYKAAWAVVGGINLPKDAESIELLQSEHCRFVLTNKPDILLADIDKGSAIGRLMLKGFVGQRNADEFPVALEAEIAEIKTERANKIGSKAVLVVEANGEIDAEIKEPLKECQGFFVTFDTVNKRDVARIHRGEIDAMKLAVAFEGRDPSRFAELGDGIYLTHETYKIVYSISISVSGEMTVCTGLSNERAGLISARYAMLQKANDMESVKRLFSQMADYETDRLKRFFSGWDALEILIAKAFKAYENDILSLLTNAGQPTLCKKFMERIKDVMKDKYRLNDKFIAVAAVLFPSAPDNEMQEDLDKFSRLKKQRDSIFHGEEFSEKDLPVDELTVLLRRYVLAYVARRPTLRPTRTHRKT